MRALTLTLVFPLMIILVFLSGCLTREKVVISPSLSENLSNLSSQKGLKSEDSWREAREAMVENDLKGRDIKDNQVLISMRKVPRHEFVPPEVKNKAYADHPLPIGFGQTISQPYVVALMTQALNLSPEDKVLEIGTGSGYQAAVLSEIVKEVYTMEIIPELAQRANETLHKLGYKNVKVRVGDGYFGWEEKAPYDAIMITAAVNHIPSPLIKQLKEGGKLILPLGSTKYWQTLTLVRKKNNSLETEYITSVRFVPMTGEALRK